VPAAGSDQRAGQDQLEHAEPARGQRYGGDEPHQGEGGQHLDPPDLVLAHPHVAQGQQQHEEE